MEVSKIYFRAALSFALALAVATVFSFSSFAARQASEAQYEPAEQNPPGASIPAGTLSGTGKITINGNAARAGATVLNGSAIATGSNGNATIEMGPLGRLDLLPDTAVTLTFLSGVVLVSMDQCGSIVLSVPAGVTGRVRTHGERARFIATRGQVDVRTIGSEVTINQGEDQTLDHAVEAIADGDAMFTVQMCDRAAAAIVPPAGSSTPGLIGIASMIAIAGGVAIGVVAGRNDGSRPLPKASEVVP